MVTFEQLKGVSCEQKQSVRSKSGEHLVASQLAPVRMERAFFLTNLRLKLRKFHFCLDDNTSAQERAAKVRVYNYVKSQNRAEFTASTKNSNIPCACCVGISHYALLLSTHMTGCSIFSTVQ